MAGLHPLVWTRTLLAALRAGGLRRRLSEGYRFLRLVFEATRPRIALQPDHAAGTAEVDTGLPDLGAERFFAEPRDPGFVGLTAFGGGLMLAVAAIGWHDFVLSLARRPAYLSVAIATFLAALTVTCLLALLWSAHRLLVAAAEGRTPLGPREKEEFAALMRGFGAAVPPDCHDHMELAHRLVELRHELADAAALNRG